MIQTDFATQLVDVTTSHKKQQNLNSTLPHKEENTICFCLILQKEEEKTKDNSNEQFTLYFKIS